MLQSAEGGTQPIHIEKKGREFTIKKQGYFCPGERGLEGMVERNKVGNRTALGSHLKAAAQERIYYRNLMEISKGPVFRANFGVCKVTVGRHGATSANRGDR